MSYPKIAISQVKGHVLDAYAAGYFIDALARFIDTVSDEDAALCEKALDQYVLGGLVAGLKIVGSNLMERSDAFKDTLEAMEASE